MNKVLRAQELETTTPLVLKDNGAMARPASRPSGAVAMRQLSPAQWDGFADRFSDILTEQTGAYNFARWGGTNIECVAFETGDTLIGGASIVVRRIAALGTGIALVKWGPMWRRAGHSADIRYYGAIVDALQREYAGRRNLHLSIAPPACDQFQDEMCNTLLDAGFSAGAMLNAPLRYLVNTALDEETLLASLDQKWRYNMRKSLKAGLEIEFVEDEAGLEAFMQLYREMLDRKKFHDHSAIDSLPHMLREQADPLRPRIVLVRHDGQPTAGGVFFVAGRTASYMFGASDARALKLRAGYAMHWWIARKLCAMENIDWYDLGGNDLDAGLHQFKKGFVGRSGLMIDAPARYQYASTVRANLFGQTVYALREAKSSIQRRLFAS